MAKKIVVVVGAGGIVAARNKNRLITSPVTKTTTFCMLPALTIGADSISSAPVCLKEGEHRDVHSGFGVWHAWSGHFRHCTDYPQAEIEVATYVASALVRGADIFWQSNKKCAVLQSNTRLVILERSVDGSNNHYYSVVTAYDKKQAQGTLVGALA
jgi:hypothetical protein